MAIKENLQEKVNRKKELEIKIFVKNIVNKHK